VNYLVHLYLSDGSAGGLLGNLMGDFVKGPLGNELPADIRAGIEQHRQIDAFAQQNRFFRRSKRRLDDSFGHCKGILVDVFYDHFLARTWTEYHPLPLAHFANQVYHLLEEHFELLPPGLQEVAPRMIRHDWLVSYQHIATVEQVLQRLEARLSRPTPLAQGLGALLENYQELGLDCQAFLRDAQDLGSRSSKKSHPL
jgi:acyl carrier protein phosphodiesterase